MNINQELLDLLQTTPLAALLEEKSRKGTDLITLDANATVEHALDVLTKFRISSAPIRASDGEYIGWLSLFELVGYVLRVMSRSSTPTSTGVEWSTYFHSLETLEARGERFGKTHIGAIIEHPVGGFVVADPSMSLWNLIEYFHKGHQKIAVQNEGSILVDVISPTDVLAFLGSKMNTVPALAALAERSLADLGLGKITPVKMSVTSPAVHAFYLMRFNNTRSIAIVDTLERGRLVGSISASDIKHIRTNKLTSLLDSVGKFASVSGLQPPVALPDGAQLYMVLTQISLYRIHQVYILGENSQPVGVCGIQDICDMIYKALTPAPKIVGQERFASPM